MIGIISESRRQAPDLLPPPPSVGGDYLLFMLGDGTEDIVLECMQYLK